MRLLNIRSIFYFNKAYLIQLLILSSLLFFSPFIKAKVLFEGKYDLNVQNKKVGFIFQKYEFNQKNKQFISRYFIKSNSPVSKSTESLTAFSDKDLNPISYTYTFNNGVKKKKIIAKFYKNKLKSTATTTLSFKKINGVYQKRKIPKILVKKTTQKIEKGVFLSTFLNYIILNNGIVSNKRMAYKAISEEDLSVYSGKVHIKNKFNYNGSIVYKISHTFNNFPFTTYINKKGEVLLSKSPLQKISTELATQPRMTVKEEWPYTF